MRTVARVLGVSVADFFIVVFVTSTVLFIRKIWFGAKSTSVTTKKYVALVDVQGILVSSSRFLKDLDEKLEQPGVKAIVVRIDSPGGLVAPSQEIFEAIKRADKKMPVVVSMGSLAASGGYYAALGGRKIFANPGTLTASIGVIMEFANLSKLYEWAKIDRYEMTAGKLKGAGSDSRPMTPEERDMFRGLLSDIHGQFRSAVKERRKLTDEELDRVADGRIMSGAQAKAAKLVDELGGFEEALTEARQLGGLPPDADVDYPEKKEGILRKLLFGEDVESGIESVLRSEALRVLTSGIAPGWKVMLLAPVR